MCLAAVHPPVTVQVILQLGACSQPGMEASVPAPSAVPSPLGFSWGQGYRQSCQFNTRDPLSAPNSSAPHGGEVPAFCTTLALLLTENLLLTVKFLHYLFFFFSKMPPLHRVFFFLFLFFIGLGLTSLPCVLLSPTNFQSVQGSSHTCNKSLT